MPICFPAIFHFFVDTVLFHGKILGIMEKNYISGNVFKVLGGKILANDDGSYTALFRGIDACVTSDTEENAIRAYIHHILGLVERTNAGKIVEPKDFDPTSLSDDIDLSDEMLHTVDGWLAAGHNVYGEGGRFFATVKDRNIIRQGVTAEKAINAAVEAIIEERAKRKRHYANIGHLFGNRR